MGGIAAAIGGVGQGAQALGSQLRSQSFAHQENSLKQLQEQYNNLAEAPGEAERDLIVPHQIW